MEITARGEATTGLIRIRWRSLVERQPGDCSPMPTGLNGFTNCPQWRWQSFPDGLDFVYIDGNHAEPFVREDITNYYTKVRPGGILGGHDFYNGFCREHDGVVKAVTEFVTRSSLPLQVELPDWWVTKPS